MSRLSAVASPVPSRFRDFLADRVAKLCEKLLQKSLDSQAKSDREAVVRKVKYFLTMAKDGN